MIQLTRLNDQPLAVNSDLIKFVENAHDTVLTLVNGEKVVVRERVEQVIERIIQFRRAILMSIAAMGTEQEPTAKSKAASASEDVHG